MAYLQLGPGDVICHRCWLRMARLEASGTAFMLVLVRAAWAQQDDLLGDWREDMAFWISYRRPLCESLPVADIERAWRAAMNKPPEVKSKVKRVAVPRQPIYMEAE